MYLLDTDTLSLIHADHPKLVKRSQHIPSAEIATTVVTRIEMLQGRFAAVLKAADAEQLLLAQARLIRTEALLLGLPVVGVNAKAAAEFAKLLLVKKFKKIGRADLLIAAITLAEKATLVTRNVRHFQIIPGLLLADWSK